MELRDKSIGHRKSFSQASSTHHSTIQASMESPNIAEIDDLAMDSRILDFYGLESLEPETWNEATANPLSPAQSPSVDKPAPIDGHNYYDDNSVDPLGIKESLGSKHMLSSNPKGFQKRAKNSILLTSRDFDAKKFLVETHRNTPYADLHSGYNNLVNLVDKRNATLKMLVKSNFDRFVGAKATVDSIYRELKVKNLGSEGFGTYQFQVAMNAALKTAESLFQPILERRLKADRIRSTAHLLDRYKSFFNLPTMLEDSFRKNLFEQAVRDYRKGRSVLNAARSQAMKAEKSPDSQLRVWIGLLKVFERVWEEAERTVSAFRSKIFSFLEDMTLSMDQHERYMIYLMDLDSPTEPAVHFIVARHDWIIKSLDRAYASHSKMILELSRKYQALSAAEARGADQLANDTEDENTIAMRKHAMACARFRKSLNSRSVHEFETFFCNDIDVMTWKTLVQLVLTFTTTITQSFPDFWILCKHFIEGKYERSHSKSVDSRNATCQDLLSNLVAHYTIKLKTAFAFLFPGVLSGPQVEEMVNGSDDQFWDAVRANLVSASHYLPKVVIAIYKCHEVFSRSLKVGSDEIGAPPEMRILLDDFKSKFIVHLCKSWKSQASLLYSHENGIVYAAKTSFGTNSRTCTRIVDLFSRLQKLIIRAIFQIVSMADWPVNSAEADQFNLKFTIASDLLTTLTDAFYESTLAFLDGIHYLVFHPTSWHDIVTGVNYKSLANSFPSSCAKYVVSLHNLAVLLGHVIPSLARLFEDLFKVNTKPKFNVLSATLVHLDEIIFESFVALKRSALVDIVYGGCFFGGYDWKSLSPPQNLHPHVNETLLLLVKTHAEVLSWSCGDQQSHADVSRPTLVQRVIVELLVDLLCILRDSYQSIDGMSPFGGLHALMDFRAVSDIAASYSDAFPQLDELERSIVSVIHENVTFNATGNKSSEIIDVPSWFDGHASDVVNMLETCKLHSEIVFVCLKNVFS
eukprot:Partr_v1_DN28932_c1_g1_i6_m24812 putative Exocyst complex component